MRYLEIPHHIIPIILVALHRSVARMRVFEQVNRPIRHGSLLLRRIHPLQLPLFAQPNKTKTSSYDNSPQLNGVVLYRYQLLNRSCRNLIFSLARRKSAVFFFQDNYGIASVRTGGSASLGSIYGRKGGLVSNAYAVQPTNARIGILLFPARRGIKISFLRGACRR